MFLTLIIVVSESSVMTIFSLLEHGVYVLKNLDVFVFWLVAPKSIIHDIRKSFSEVS